ncbi:MAG: FdhF/YdeP family oxidoreductase [Planctomycetota bacterium]|nr:MAG: FdhF/YdeP family oxidoreductase [Planctomycetota bacterium]
MRPRRSFRERLPFGLGVRDKPRHYREMLGVAWENRDQLGYAWRILKDGVCDGCSLGPRGLKDDVIQGTHLCLTRLKLLRVNTMGAIRDEALLGDIGRLRSMDQRALQALGRIPYPMIHRRGARGFVRLSWDEALAICGEYGRGPDGRRLAPGRWGFFSTSRGTSNEAYYVFQKAARLLGTNNVDLCARLCHAASVYGLAETLGVGAPTCSLSDFIGTDLLLVWGSDLANNQPVSTKYLMHAKRAGTRIFVINPAREKGLETYWVPSDLRSAVLGSDLCDEWFQVRVGGDIAFLHGVLKALFAAGQEDPAFIAAKTAGFEELKRYVEALEWPALERDSGLPRAEMEQFAAAFGAARSCVAVYSMGLTQHAFGVDNVKAIVNLMLSRGMLGRDKCGIMPIRGHSGVQGGGECGVDPVKYPGGFKVGVDTRRFEELWGRPLNPEPGLKTGAMMQAAHDGRIEFLYSLGGNLIDNMPDPEFMHAAFTRVRFRVHQDIVLNPSAVAEPGEAVLVLPAQTRYEHAGGITSTNTERRIRFSPEIPGPRIAEARAEWWIPAQVAIAVDPALRGALEYPGGTGQIREEMQRAMPAYQGVAALRQAGDWVQWGGPHLFGDGFAKMPGGRARFTCVPLPNRDLPEGRFVLTTRRGKQFNSMVFADEDRLQGGRARNDVFIAPAEVSALGLRAGQRVVLRNEVGRFEGVLRPADLPPRTLQVYWPESNVLIPRRYDPVSEEPDYNAVVALEPAD